MRKVTEDYIGTCQACFGEFKVGPDKLMVLHGYKRPGDGSVHSECGGTGHAPFEYDYALTVQIIARHRANCVKWQNRIDKIASGEITSLFRSERQYSENHRYIGDKLIEYTPESDRWDRIKDWAISGLEREIDWYTKVANYLQTKVDAWQRCPIVGFDLPLTGRERGLRKPYDPIEEAAAAARAAEKAVRDAKPGKLSVIFYRPKIDRPGPIQEVGETVWRKWRLDDEADEKAFADGIRTWVKANITGKSIVRPQVGDYDLPSAISKTGDYNVVTVNLPWDYLDQITTMFSTAVPYSTETKKKSFTVAGTARAH